MGEVNGLLNDFYGSADFHCLGCTRSELSYKVKIEFNHFKAWPGDRSLSVSELDDQREANLTHSELV